MATGKRVSFNVSQIIPKYQAASPAVVLNQTVRGLDMSPTVGINELSNRLRAEGKTIYKLGLGQSPFPVPDFMVQSMMKHAGEKDYLPTRGLPALREAVAEFGKSYCGMKNCTKDDVLIGPGSKELMFGLQLCYYGELVIPRGSWVSYQPQSQIVNRSCTWIDTSYESRWQLTSNDLLDVFSSDPNKPRILLLNYPSNPHGQRYTREELKAIADVCRDHGVLVLSDEIYAPLNFDGTAPHCSIAEYYPEGTIISTGVSKWAGAGGWRCGAFLFPENLRWLQDAMSAVASETYTSVCAPVQYASIEPFRDFYGGKMQEYLRVKNRTLTGLSNYATKKLQNCGARVCPPEGGFYIFPDFSNTPQVAEMEEKWRHKHNVPHNVKFTSTAFSEFLLEETGVAQLGGGYFGFPRGHHLRMAFVNFQGEDILADKANLPENAADMEPFLRKHCPLTLQAFDTLEDYFGS